MSISLSDEIWNCQMTFHPRVKPGCPLGLIGPPQNADLYEAGSRLRKPLSNTNNYFIGGGSSILTFTPTGEYPCELHVTPRLSDWVGTDIGTILSAHTKPVPSSRQRIALVPMSRYPAFLPSPNYWTPQPSHFNSRGEVILVTVGRVPIDGDHNLVCVAQQPAKEVYPPTTERDGPLPQNCAQCQVSIPRLLTDHLCGSCCSRKASFDANQLETDKSPSEPPNATLASGLKAKEVVDLTQLEEANPLIKERVNPASTSETARPSRIKLKIKPPKPPSTLNETAPDQTRPTKRRRIGDGVRDSMSSPGRMPECSLQTAGGGHDGLQRNKPNKALGLCSTSGCAGYISAESCASRCIDCVKYKWKRRKEQFNSPKRRDPNDTQTMGDVNPTAHAKSKPRKSVTWADMVTEALEDGEVVRRPASLVKEDFEQNTESNDAPQRHDTEADKVSHGPVCADSLPHIPDWDSDLSDLTDTDETDSSATEVRISAPTGLKIRIPARPKIIYDRKCKNPTCSQLLATTYSRETCVVCRARKRRRQRRQQNPYFWQDWSGEDLLSDQENLVQFDFLQNNGPGKHLSVVPNARVCSTSECNYIIAPHEEYNWKTCALCRLYQREWRLARKQEISPVGSTSQVQKRSADAMKLFSSFEELSTRPPGQGRCRSIDCGFLVDNSSIFCRQCVARRGKLMRKAGIFDEKIDTTSETVHKIASEIASYPQYKCFAVLVNDFGDRLSTFLKSQTTFFLFNARYANSGLAKVLFAFDGEYSVVALDFDILGRKTTIDDNALELKKEFERVGRIKFAPKRMVSVLEGGGIAIRFVCSYCAPILYPVKEGSTVTISESTKPMKGELEVAVFPDQSHRFLPGEKIIIRFRLFG